MSRIITMDERDAVALAKRRMDLNTAQTRLAEAAPRFGGCYRVFGSAARGDIHSRSDLDLLLDFPKDKVTDAMLAAEDICRDLRIPVDTVDMRMCNDRFLSISLPESRRLG